MGDVYTLLCLRPAELRKAFGLGNLCYSKISVVMLLDGVQDCWNLESEKKENMRCAQMLHIEIASVIHAWCKKYKTVAEFN